MLLLLNLMLNRILDLLIVLFKDLYLDVLICSRTNCGKILSYKCCASDNWDLNF